MNNGKLICVVLFLTVILVSPVSAVTTSPVKIKLLSNFDFESDVANSFFVNGNQEIQKEFVGTITVDGNKFDVDFDPIVYQYGYISGYAKGTINGDQIDWTLHSRLVDEEFPSLVEVAWDGTGTGQLVGKEMSGNFHFEKYHSQSDPLGNPHSASIIGDTYFSVELPCDFSTQPLKEKCFGGIGVQCNGVPGLSFEKNVDNCMVKGYVSGGSILHDKCCIDTRNNGFMCAHPKNTKCRKEWDVAYNDFWNLMYWQYEWGPYVVGGPTDNTASTLKARNGAYVAKEYRKILCPTGDCTKEVRGSTIVVGKIKYCMCE